METLLKYLIENIIDNKDSLKIESREEGADTIIFDIIIDDADKGIVIGNKGNNIQAIRKLINILGRKQGKKVFLKIL